MTPLKIALSNHKFKIAQILIDNGAVVNEAYFMGFSYIHYAAIDNDIDVLEFLIKNGVSIHQKTSSWISGFQKPICLTVNTDDKSTDALKLFLDHGASPNTICHEGYHVSLLDQSIEKGRIKKVKYLLDNSANIEHEISVSEKIQQPLAIFFNFFLCKFGIGVPYSFSSLSLSLRYKHDEITFELLKRGVPIKML